MFEINRDKISLFIAELRREKGFTQKQLAEKLHISAKAVSKWECGQSIPDTGLLVPLAELLGVSTTELLMGERLENDATLGPEELERILKAALACPEGNNKRAFRTNGPWKLIYPISLAVGLIGLYLNSSNGFSGSTLGTCFILSAIFGAYFCFFVKNALPVIYDHAKSGFYRDGAFRMNIPGVRFTNSNWPYIILCGRIWACLALSLYPLLFYIMSRFFPDFWAHAELYIFLVLILGGLFIPIYAVSKKFE